MAYHIDGYEELKKEDVTESVLDKKKYTQKQVTENSEAESGKGAYKLITEEEWYVVTEISPDTAKDFLAKEKTSIQVRFLKDNMTMIAGLEIKQKDKDRYYAYLTFDNSMVRYLSERYLDIELILEDVTGLRVPKSAVIKKDCYMLPLDYIVTNGETKEKGVLVKEKNGKTRFQAADVYYQDENEKQACVSAENLPEGTVIRMQDSNNTKTLSDPVEQPGVYEAGSGYAVLRQSILQKRMRTIISQEMGSAIFFPIMIGLCWTLIPWKTTRYLFSRREGCIYGTGNRIYKRKSERSGRTNPESL